ncbi:YeeE/YedE family protein [Klebsiella pneumoniae subsp. pneumoniae]|nr:YeeE/YedE family protein [Klebsiella pneumoniae subsp. pneumoniae]
MTRIDGRMIIGMFGGCLAAALWANNVKLRLPRSRIRIAQAVAGGIIAGFGARLAMGCNLAAFFTRHSAVLPARLAVCHRHRHRLLVWRPLHAAVPFSHPGKNAKSVHRLAVNPKTAAGAPPFPPGDGGLFRHDRLGPAHRHQTTRRSAWRCCLALPLACLLSARRSALPPPFAICGSPAGR